MMVQVVAQAVLCDGSNMMVQYPQCDGSNSICDGSISAAVFVMAQTILVLVQAVFATSTKTVAVA